MKGFKVRVIEAKKEGERGRVKGGMIMAVKSGRGIDEVESIKGYSEEFIGAKMKIIGETWWIGTVNMRRRGNETTRK